MNPWKIIGWIVLGLIIVTVCFCGLGVMGLMLKQQQTESTGSTTSLPAADDRPLGVRVVSLDCEKQSAYDVARVTVENRGPEISFPKVFIEFTKKDGSVAAAEDAYFSPPSIPSGSSASATVMTRADGAHSCRIARMQDRTGKNVVLN